MAKQAAWEAARSSSGEVRPSGASVREAQLTGRSWKVPLEPALTPPLPLIRSPCQVTVAVRTAAIPTPPAVYPALPEPTPNRRPMTTDKATTPLANPIIRGKKVYLRPSERSDLDDFVRWFNDADTMRYLAMRAPMGRAREEKCPHGVLERPGKRDHHFVSRRVGDGTAPHAL